MSSHPRVLIRIPKVLLRHLLYLDRDAAFCVYNASSPPHFAPPAQDDIARSADAALSLHAFLSMVNLLIPFWF